MVKSNLEACLSPYLSDLFLNSNTIVVVIDTLRATSSICNALENGADNLIPVGTIEEAKMMKEKGFLVAAERDGYVLDFADFGNSPFNFTPERVKGKSIVYSTTNGTRTIEIASAGYMVVIGSFLNISALTDWLKKQNRDVLLLCAGWKGKINIEDSLFAGALAERLLESSIFETKCDSVKITLDMWSLAKDDIPGYIEKAAQRTRLKEKGLDDCISFCHTPDTTRVIPVYSNGVISKLEIV